MGVGGNTVYSHVGSQFCCPAQWVWSIHLLAMCATIPSPPPPPPPPSPSPLPPPQIVNDEHVLFEEMTLRRTQEWVGADGGEVGRRGRSESEALVRLRTESELADLTPEEVSPSH